MSTATAEFLQRFAAHINDSPTRDALLPALVQVREKCLDTIREGTSSAVTLDGSLGCRWCLSSWSLGQYSIRLKPQKRPRGFKSLRNKYSSKPEEFAQGKKKRKFIGHNFMSLKCDVCFGITKVPALKPVEEPQTESPLLPPPPKKKKKGKKRDDFAGLNPAAVKSAQQKTARECESKVLNVFEVLSPSLIQNGVNIVSNRLTKSRSQPSASSPDKQSLIKSNAAPISAPKSSTASSKNKKKKVKSHSATKEPKKPKNVTSALASFLNSL